MNHNNKKELVDTAIQYQTEWEKKLLNNKNIQIFKNSKIELIKTQQKYQKDWEKKLHKCNSIKLSTTTPISRDKHKTTKISQI